MCQTIANGDPDPRNPGQTHVLLKLRKPVDLFHTLKTMKGCYMFSLGPSSGSSDSVRIYRRVIFGKQNW
jgi:hypothetical protein